MQAKPLLSFIPNSLSILRIAFIPLFVLFYITSGSLHWVAALLFALACFTDWLDGLIARQFGAATKFGAFIDPVADKLVVVSALVLLIGSYGSLWLTLPGIVIVGRELLIASLREWMAEVQARSQISVSIIAKVKTAIQMVAIIILLANPPHFDKPWTIIGLVLIYLATAFTLWSMIIHLRAAWGKLREGFLSE